MMKKNDYATSASERFSFGFYAFGAILSYYIIYSFLQLFFTDYVGISASAVAVIFVFAKVIDAIDDPLFGVAVDKLNLKKGKFIPWLKIASFAIPFTTIFIFLNPVSQTIPIWAKIIWAVLSYILWDIAYTMYDAPLNSLIIVTSKNEKERNLLFAITSFMVYVGGLIVVVIVPTLYKSFSWAITGMIIGALAFISMIFLPFKAKERFDVKTENEPSIKEILSCVIKNKYLLLIVLIQIVSAITDFSTTLQTYFAIYCLGSDEMLTPIALASVLPILLVAFFVPKLLTKVDSGKAYIVSKVFAIIITFVIYFVGYQNIYVVIILIALRAAVSTVSVILSTIFISDTIEYGQYKTGERNQGVSFSLKAFVNKMVVALAGALGMLSLALIGYKEGGMEQTEEVINGIWFLYSLAPAFGSIASTIIFAIFYKLKDCDVKLMTRYNRKEISREELEAGLSRKY